jgi:hypothetical protein
MVVSTINNTFLQLCFSNSLADCIKCPPCIEKRLLAPAWNFSYLISLHVHFFGCWSKTSFLDPCCFVNVFLWNIFSLDKPDFVAGENLKLKLHMNATGAVKPNIQHLSFQVILDVSDWAAAFIIIWLLWNWLCWYDTERDTVIKLTTYKQTDFVRWLVVFRTFDRKRSA